MTGKNPVRLECTGTWRCMECGSHNVVAKHWVQLNTNEILDVVDGINVDGNAACEDCGANCVTDARIVYEGED